jgi:hypothetical protein
MPGERETLGPIREPYRVLEYKLVWGPDRGESKTPTKPVTYTGSPYKPRTGALPVGPDGGILEDKYGKGIKAQGSTPSLRLDLTINQGEKKLSGIVTKSHANGAELMPDPGGLNGGAVAYFDAGTHPYIDRVPGVSVKFPKDTSIGPDGQRERRIVFEGPDDLIKISLSGLDIDPETITVRIKDEVTELPQSPAPQRQEVAA